MKSGAVNVMWLPSAKSKPRMFSCSTKLFYTFWVLVFGSWLTVIGSGFLVYNLYGEYSRIKEEHAVLAQKASQLDAVMKQVESLKKDEATIRGFLGLEKISAAESFAGQGGIPNVDISSIAPEDALSIDEDLQGSVPPAMGEAEKEAAFVASQYRRIAEYMRDQRSSWEHNPSIMPVQAEKYWISSGFGWRTNPFTGERDFHNGIDIAGAPQTPIIAPAKGKVIKVGEDKYLGRFVQLDHSKGVVTYYGHLASFNVKEGDVVKRGDVIAYMGNSGLSTGHHVHYIVKVNGKAVNPRRYMLNMTAGSLLEG